MSTTYFIVLATVVVALDVSANDQNIDCNYVYCEDHNVGKTFCVVPGAKMVTSVASNNWWCNLIREKYGIRGAAIWVDWLCVDTFHVCYTPSDIHTTATTNKWITSKALDVTTTPRVTPHSTSSDANSQSTSTVEPHTQTQEGIGSTLEPITETDKVPEITTPVLEASTRPVTVFTSLPPSPRSPDALEKRRDDDSSTVVTVAVPVTLCVVLVITVIILIFVYRRRRARRDGQSKAKTKSNNREMAVGYKTAKHSVSGFEGVAPENHCDNTGYYTLYAQGVENNTSVGGNETPDVTKETEVEYSYRNKNTPTECNTGPDIYSVAANVNIQDVSVSNNENTGYDVIPIKPEQEEPYDKLHQLKNNNSNTGNVYDHAQFDTESSYDHLRR